MEDIIADVPAPPMQEGHAVPNEAEQIEQAVQVQEHVMQAEVQMNADIAVEDQAQADPIAPPENVLAPDQFAAPEVNQPALPIARRRGGKISAPPSVAHVRRSNRLAGLAAGFKDHPPADNGEGTSKNLTAEFEAHVVDASVPAPPVLPTSMLQAIGRDQCQIATTMLSEEKLNYDSTNDSIESD